MKAFSLSIIILFCLSFHSCSKSSPTEPEQPKPRAKITVEVAKWPLDVSWFNWDVLNYITITVEVVVSESNGVGANVATVRARVYYEDKFKAEKIEAGGRLNPYGSLTVFLLLQVYGPDPEHKVDKLSIEAKGGDDNGYPFTETVSYDLSWGDEMQIRQ